MGNREMASRLRDISRRIGPVCPRQWIRDQLDALAGRLEREADTEDAKCMDCGQLPEKCQCA